LSITLGVLVDFLDDAFDPRKYIDERVIQGQFIIDLLDVFSLLILVFNNMVNLSPNFEREGGLPL